jgi:hypothetical protein
MLSTPLQDVLRVSRRLNQRDAIHPFPSLYVQVSTTTGNNSENNQSIFTIIIK